MSLWKRFKQSINNWLESLAKSNAATFGNSTPNCCSLNRQSNGKGAAYVRHDKK
ncbi:hypothetical protein FACS1894202_12420 [Clostridia bacterium]|nr:hypothetical protein FACS1894202_12420 [Clostridia bacterium]